MDTIYYKFEHFEGPLELLLSLVIKNKMKIDDIPIDLLCEQYMAYINEAALNNVELACEFLFMASELMLIKSRMLLPRTPENPEDPRATLVNALVEYQKAKLAASQLSDMYSEFGLRMIKEQDDVTPDRSYVAPHDVELLKAALIHVLSEADQKKLNEIRNDFENIVVHRRVPVKTVISELIDKLKNTAVLYLDTYFLRSDSRSDLISKFLGILELLKSHIVAIDDNGETENGVTNLRSHITITLIATDDEIKNSSLEWETV